MRKLRISFTLTTLTIVLIIICSLALPANVDAKSKRTVYLLTTENTTDYDNHAKYSYQFKYNKKGFVKNAIFKSKYEHTSKKSKFIYNKKNQATKVKYANYYRKTKTLCGCAALKYDKKGFLTSVSANASYKLKWNKKLGVITRSEYLWDYDGGDHSITWYKYNKKGKLTGGKSYSFDYSEWEEDSYTFKCTRKGGKQYIKKYYNPKVCWSTTVQKMRNGNVISETEYQGKNKLKTSKYKFKKKKVSAKNYKKILRQQETLYYMLID